MLYHGVDLVEVARIRHAVVRYGQRFVQRVYTATEQADCLAGSGDVRYEALAARWAAKEACAKALGIGLRGLGALAVADRPRAGFHEIEWYVTTMVVLSCVYRGLPLSKPQRWEFALWR